MGSKPQKPVFSTQNRFPEPEPVVRLVTKTGFESRV